MLNDKLDAFKEALSESNVGLETTKLSMKKSLMTELERFSHHVEKLRAEFVGTGIQSLSVSGPEPAVSDDAVEWAFSVMKRFKKQLVEDKQTASAIKVGLDIFGIEQPSYKDMNDTEKELRNLVVVWSLIREWKESHWARWRAVPFRDLELIAMEQETMTFVAKMDAVEHTVREWEVHSVARRMCTHFVATLPMVHQLKNPALRPRHWLRLKKELNNFEPVSMDNGFDDIAFGDIHALGLFKYADVIAAVSETADKEEKIEAAISRLDAVWSNLEIQMVEYGGYYKMGSTAALIQQLEDDQVLLIF